MKTIFRGLSVLLFSFASSHIVVGQSIDSMLVSPSFTPLPTDTVKVYLFNSFPSGYCADQATYTKAGFNIFASSTHCLGPLSFICQDVDTLIIPPPHALGTYRVIFALSSGFSGPPCSPGIIPADIDTAYYTVTSSNPTDNPPVLSIIDGDTICDNEIFGPVSFTLSDEDLPSVGLSATSDNQIVVPNANITLGGSLGNRNIMITPQAGIFGLANIRVLAMDSLGQLDSVTFQIMVKDCDSTTSAIRDLELMDYKIYPNPVNGQLVIEHRRDQKIMEVFLTDEEGQIHLPPVQFLETEVRMNLLPVAAGVYILTVVDQHGVGKAERIVVTNNQ